MEQPARLPILLVSALVLLLSGCATRVNSPVSTEQRDTSNTYDGQWNVHRLKSARRQIIGNDHLNCATKEFRTAFQVNDGVLSTYWDGTVFKTNVASDGRFRLEIPTDREYKRTLGENEAKSTITYILQGSLAGDEPSGLYTVGMARLNNQGCDAKLKFYSTSLISYQNSYQNITTGTSSRSWILESFASARPIPDSNNIALNNELVVNIDSRTNLANTITVSSPSYVDANGVSIGTSRKALLESTGTLDISQSSNHVTDFRNGLVYWFDDNERISRIVLTHQLIVPSDIASRL